MLQLGGNNPAINHLHYAILQIEVMSEGGYDYHLWREFTLGDTEQHGFDDVALIFGEFSQCDGVGLCQLPSVRVDYTNM